MKDLHILPRVKDSWSYLYVEHSKIDQDAKSVTVHDTKGAIQVPCAVLSLLMLGPGHFDYPCGRKDPRRQRLHADVVRRGGCPGLWSRPR